ncbi:hypothetical protein FJZ28_01715 [Candidatus Peregrinibacteria bacterium]|nr:hypothetical protein [Candidatus Peregrinibacteria bacterium]
MTSDATFVVGLIGSLILVGGAAYPLEKVSHPAKSVKNWLFTIGGVCMLAYSLINYLTGGTIFFVILQLFIVLTTILMMLNIDDRYDTPIVAAGAIAMVIWSLTLFEGTSTVFFVIGLSGIGIGYALNMGTFKQNAALTLGSALIAYFSYREGNQIFLWLNVFFALFSGYYATKLFRYPHTKK